MNDFIAALIAVALVIGLIVVIAPDIFDDSIVENKELGKIVDFEVSAGGFGSSDKCKIEVESGHKVVASGGICKKIETGKILYKETRKQGNSYYRVEGDGYR